MSQGYAMPAAVAVTGIMGNTLSEMLTRTPMDEPLTDQCLDDAMLLVLSLYQASHNHIWQDVEITDDLLASTEARAVVDELREMFIQDPGPMSWDEGLAQWVDPLDNAATRLIAIATKEA